MLWRFAFVYTNNSGIPFVCLQRGIVSVRKRFVVCIQNEASDYLLPSARLLTYFSRQYVHACADLFPQVVNKSLMCM